MAQAGVLRAADPVLDPSVRAVAGVEMRELPERGVGGEGGVAPSVTFFERVQLRAGVRAFPTNDDAGPGRISSQCPGGQNTADLGQSGAVAVTAVGVDRVCPDGRREGADRGPFLVGDRRADRELAAHRGVAEAADVGEELAGAAGGIGADQHRGAVAVSVGELDERGVETVM
jgi:hypothetical protein